MCVLDENGRQVLEKTVRGPRPKLVEYLKRFEEPFRVCYEASCGYGPLHDRLSMTADEVLVAHPGHLRLIFHSKKKNDQVDAQKLATLRSARFQVSFGEVRITSSDGVSGTHR